MKVLLLANRFAPSIGGIERQTMLMAKEFQKRGIDVFVVTDRHERSLPAFEIVDGIPVRRVWSLWTIRRPFRMFANRLKGGEFVQDLPNGQAFTIRFWHRGFQAIKRWAHRLISYRIPMYSLFISSLIMLYRKRNEYDIVQVLQTNLLAVGAALAGRLLQKPVVACDALYLGMDELKEFLFWKMTTRLVTVNCTFVALSRHIERDLIRRGIAPERVVRIPNAVELPEIHTRRSAPGSSVLFVGNVAGDLRQKGLDVLLKAWKQVIEEVHRAQLTIVGGGDFNSFRRLVQSYTLGESVRFVGPQKIIGTWYETNQIFVLPSRYEGMSNALLEAMSYARSCVVTEISGSDDLIAHNVNGLKVPADNSKALAESLIFLMKHHEKAVLYGKRARRMAATHFNPGQMASSYVEVYARLLSNAHRTTPKD